MDFDHWPILWTCKINSPLYLFSNAFPLMVFFLLRRPHLILLCGLEEKHCVVFTTAYPFMNLQPEQTEKFIDEHLKECAVHSGRDHIKVISGRLSIDFHVVVFGRHKVTNQMWHLYLGIFLTFRLVAFQ